MTLFLITALSFAAVVVLRRFTASFGAQKTRDYAGTAPEFDIRRHLSGPMLSEGMIFGPTGRVATRFVAQMTGDWTGATGVLSEVFSYAEGGGQSRQWNIELGENGRFTATADDIIGTAQGQQTGATVRVTYRLRLTEAAGGHVLDVTDWMYLMENGTIMNKSEMRKFGIKVAELVATIRPVEN